ncbi:hypothetical protein CAter10_1569 [Collimonas arenae]|nr:hypothetical protein CAter10_1569 [Collimonas arenae]
MNKCLLAVTLALLGSGSVLADGAQNKQSALEECSAYSGAGMRGCLQKKADASGIELARAESNVRGALKKWDEDAQYVKLAQSRFEVSNKEFLRYRDAYCGFNASLGGGAIGGALDTRKLACTAELNVNRSQQILDAVSHLPLK